MQAADLTNMGVKVEEGDKQALILINKVKLAKDFYLPTTESDETQPLNQIGDGELADTQIKIFSQTLHNMASIIGENIGILFLIRAITGSTYDEYVAAMLLTCSERTSGKYTHYMMHVGREAFSESLNSLWNLL